MKIAILTREANSEYNSIVNGIPTTYLNIIKQKFYPIFIDSTLSLNLHKLDVLEQLSQVDGIIIPGGDKVSETDLFVIDYCYKHNIPLLGICLGMQEIAYYFDNNAIKPIGNNSHHDMIAKYLHTIKLTKNGYLNSLIKEDVIKVNSRHKYHVNPNESYFIEAKSDNIIEAIKVKNTKYMLGVQFHPEIMYEYDENAKKIIDDFFKHVSNT